MKSLLSLLLIFITTFSLWAQEFEREFGDVLLGDLKMVTSEKYPDASAVVLFDRGESVFVKSDESHLRKQYSGFYNRETVDTRYAKVSMDYVIRFTRTRRILILDEEGEDYKKIKIPLFRNDFIQEHLISIEATTYSNKEDVLLSWDMDDKEFKEKQIDQQQIERTYTCPRAKAGRIVEYRYVIESPFMERLPDWSFQDRVPTIYSEYQVSMIPFYEYVFLAQGLDKFDVERTEKQDIDRSWGNATEVFGKNIEEGGQFQDIKYTYGMRDIPAFEDEAYITSINDYRVKMDFQLARENFPHGGSRQIMTTWPELSKEMLADPKFGKYLKNAQKLAKKKYDFVKLFSGTDALTRAEKVIYRVRKDFSWNGEFEKRSTMSAKDFMEKRKGNSAELNLFLLACLKEAGVKAKPVLISTRNHGRFKTEYPFEHLFNNVIIHVDTEDPFLADATSRQLAFDLIPSQCLNDKGFVVNPEEVSWIPLDADTIAHTIHDITIRPDVATSSAQVSASISSLDYAAFHKKQLYENDTAKIKQEICSSLTEVNRIKTSNYDRIDRPYSIGFEGKLALRKDQETFELDPFIGLAMTENLLQQKYRDYPVDLVYAKANDYRVRVEVPQGYEVATLPETYSIDNSLASISLSAVQEGSVVEITGSYSFKKAVYESKEYAKLRAYMNKVVEHFNRPLVLVPAQN